ncbi:DUF3592 domain-containing protein [uncultured Gulosibacter sp.]|uniref:DUF3592 domain-containing protein n=1 Tax=uncultured Gulosibacter sp. TaxID=1339167 RepID=UPI002889F86D|nr:DUF3592 domain-containing protein [uncultured Gulosibacter sp.]
MTWLWIALGALSIGIGIIFAIGFLRLRSWEPVIGEVISNLKDTTGDGSILWRPVFELTDNSGRTQTATANFSRSHPYQIGESVPLLADPDDYSRLSTANIKVFLIGAGVFIAVGAVMLVIAALGW